MLILKVFANDKQIDEVKIHNVSGAEFNEDSYNRYEIMKPVPKQNVQIYHLRRTGWMPLVHKALEILIKQKNGSD